MENLSSLDISHFITKNAKDMSYMFHYDSKILDLNVTKFDTSLVTNMAYMFSFITIKNFGVDDDN